MVIIIRYIILISIINNIYNITLYIASKIVINHHRRREREEEEERKKQRLLSHLLTSVQDDGLQQVACGTTLAISLRQEMGFNKIALAFQLAFLLSLYLTSAALKKTTKKEVLAPNRTEWLVDTLRSNLNALLNKSSLNPGARDLTNGALAVLILDHDCDTAISLLRQFGSTYDMSFGGESIPAIFYRYFQPCFRSRPKDKAFLQPPSIVRCRKLLMPLRDKIEAIRICT